MRTGLILYFILDEVRKIVFIGEGATGKTSILARYSLVSFYYSISFQGQNLFKGNQKIWKILQLLRPL